MPESDSPTKPTPSIEEINAYLEESAARTKKRLPLMGTGAAPKKPVTRVLPVTVSVPTAPATGATDEPSEKK